MLQRGPVQMMNKNQANLFFAGLIWRQHVLK